MQLGGFAAAEISKRLVGLPGAAADAGKALLGRIVILADVERLGVGAGRLLLVAEALVSQAAAGPGGEALRLRLYRLVEIGRGGLASPSAN